MLTIAVFLQVTNQNLLLGYIPESLGLLLFGIGLVTLTVILRGIFRRVEKTSDENQIEN
jgi:uncharacterized membrane protein YidH (DUF202 family)